MINLVSRMCIIAIIWRLIKQGTPSKSSESNSEIISEESLKEIYIQVYLGLNKAIQYLRNLIQMKYNYISIFVRFS